MDEDLSVLESQVVTVGTKLASAAVRFPAHRDMLMSIVENLSPGQSILTVFNRHDEGINHYCLNRCVRLLRMYNEQLMQNLDTLLASNKPKKRYLGEIQIAASKIFTLWEIFLPAASVNEDDLMSGENRERRAELGRVVTRYRFSNPEKLRRHVKKMVQAVTAGNAFISKAYEKTGTSRKLTLGVSALYYNIFKSKALLKARISFAKPSIEVAKSVWDLMDSRLMAPVMETLATGIVTNRKIHIPRSTHLSDFLDPEKRKLAGFDLKKSDDKIPIRILANFPVFTSGHIESNSSETRKVVFHIHGGGFIAMSSRSHQNYTRRWAKETGAVVFSVDYRLAPEFPFPAALDDVWCAYLWVKYCSEPWLGIRSSEIVVTGDSAGGNLCCGILNRAIESGVADLIPSGALLTYPALCLEVARYTPSLELALEDLIVHHTFLRLCLQSYLPSSASHPATDYFISPLHTPTANLMRFPPVRMMVGDCDPLQDDCWRLVSKLFSLGKDVHMTEFEGLPHGFLGFDLRVNGVKETRDTVLQGAAYLRELLHIS